MSAEQDAAVVEIRAVLRHVASLIHERRLSEVDALFDRMTADMSAPEIIALLTATLPVASRLPRRANFVGLAMNALAIRYGVCEARALLEGL